MDKKINYVEKKSIKNYEKKIVKKSLKNPNLK